MYHSGSEGGCRGGKDLSLLAEERDELYMKRYLHVEDILKKEPGVVDSRYITN